MCRICTPSFAGGSWLYLGGGDEGRDRAEEKEAGEEGKQSLERVGPLVFGVNLLALGAGSARAGEGGQQPRAGTERRTGGDTGGSWHSFSTPAAAEVQGGLCEPCPGPAAPQAQGALDLWTPEVATVASGCQ